MREVYAGQVFEIAKPALPGWQSVFYVDGKPVNYDTYKTMREIAMRKEKES